MPQRELRKVQRRVGKAGAGRVGGQQKQKRTEVDAQRLMAQAALLEQGFRPVGVSLDELYEVDPVPLGHGHFGQVLKARDRSTGELVAIKELLPGIEEKELALEVLELVYAGRYLCHPNVVCYRDHFSIGDKKYVVMGYVPGNSLFEDMQKRWGRPVSLVEAYPVVVGLMRGLQFLHRQGLAHRDIKPENVVLRSDNGKPVIVDLGLACHTRHECSMASGTRVYIAPELLNEARVCEARQSCDIGIKGQQRGDIYALGVTLKDYLTGFTDRPAINETLRVPKNFYPRSEKIQSVVYKMMSVDPKKRPTIDAALAELYYPKPPPSF